MSTRPNLLRRFGKKLLFKSQGAPSLIAPMQGVSDLQSKQLAATLNGLMEKQSNDLDFEILVEKLRKVIRENDISTSKQDVSANRANTKAASEEKAGKLEEACRKHKGQLHAAVQNIRKRHGHLKEAAQRLAQAMDAALRPGVTSKSDATTDGHRAPEEALETALASLNDTLVSVPTATADTPARTALSA